MTSRSLASKARATDDIGVKFGHTLQVLTDWVDTTVFVAVCGRGTAKSTVIQARRLYR